MITGRFLAWLFLLILSFQFLTLSGYRTLLFFWLLLLLFPIFVLVQFFISIRKIQIEQRLIEPVVERSNPTTLQIFLKNKGNYHFASITLLCLWQDKNGQKILSRKMTTLRARTETTTPFILDCPHCGVLTGGLQRVGLRDLFGFFEFSLHRQSYWRNQRSCVYVIPAWKRIDSEWLIPSNWPIPGQTSQNKVSPELDELANIRSYHPGDSMKRIHWKLSARLNNLMTREFEDPTRRFVCFSLDPVKPVVQGPVDYCLDHLLETAATSMRAFLANQRQIKWLDADHSWQPDEALQLDQFDLMRQSISFFSWDASDWSEHLSLQLQQIQPDLLVLLSWNFSLSIRRWLEVYLQNNGRVMFLWLTNENQIAAPELQMEWDKMLQLGMHGYKVPTGPAR